MAKLRINKQEFPFELTKAQRDRCLMMLDYFKRKHTFKGFIEHIDLVDKQISYAFAGWFLVHINQPSKADFPDIFSDIFSGKVK